jgi:hypothetical protein
MITKSAGLFAFHGQPTHALLYLIGRINFLD